MTRKKYIEKTQALDLYRKMLDYKFKNTKIAQQVYDTSTVFELVDPQRFYNEFEIWCDEEKITTVEADATPLTLDDLVNELNNIKTRPGTSEEEDHLEADDLLLDYINDERVRKAFIAIKKWYA